MAPTVMAGFRPMPWAMPRKATPMEAMVPQEVPVAREVMEQMMTTAGRKMPGLRIFSP